MNEQKYEENSFFYNLVKKIKMGRSPLFEDLVVPIPQRETPTMMTAVREGDVLRITGAEPTKPQGLELGMLLPFPRIERFCSTYGWLEDKFPSVGASYRVTNIETYPFDNKHGRFTYRVWCMECVEDDDRMCTWVIREDGEVLNIESFSSRGCVLGFVVVNAQG
jgi:hypothetical protein